MSSDVDTGPDAGQVDGPDIDYDEDRDLDDIDAETLTLEPPRMATGGMLKQLWRTRQYLKKREKLIGKGYVQWFLIEDTFPRPIFVKPSRKGGGVPELKHDGERYLFPRTSRMPSDEGMWTAVHRKGESDPINIREPSELSIPADRLEEYLNLRVSTTPPSWLDTLDLDASTLITVLIALIIGFALLNQFAGII